MYIKIIKITIITLLGLGIILYFLYKFWFLRNPEREKINDNTKFISPANGKIVQILNRDNTTGNIKIPVIKKHHQAFKTFTNDVANKGYLISIMMTPLDVHYQRAPLSAKLIKQTHTSGKFLNAIKLSQLNNIIFENERNEMLRETKDGFKFKVIQIAGKLARRIVPMATRGNIVKQGDTIGLIKFGSQVTIILPKKNTDLLAKVGDIVIDGKTILANIKQ